MAATILDNAVTSIQVGVEDLRAGPKRTISAVRNLQAGVLLLLKAKLHQLSPPGSDEVLLKEHVVPRRAPDGTIHFVGSGSKTVDVETLLKRLQALEIDVDAGAIRKLTKERNNVEHYYTQMSDEALRALAASVLVVVRDFAKRHLQVEPLDLLGEATWTALLQHEAVHDAEHAAALAARSKLSWPTTRLQDACEAFSCSKCGASLWRPVDGDDFDCVVFRCGSCGDELGAGSFAEAALEQQLAVDAYDPGDPGEPSPLAFCHGCQFSTYVRADQACAFCQYELDYRNCLRCNESLDIDDQELGGLCGYCEHITGKDD